MADLIIFPNKLRYERCCMMDRPSLRKMHDAGFSIFKMCELVTGKLFVVSKAERLTFLIKTNINIQV